VRVPDSNVHDQRRSIETSEPIDVDAPVRERSRRLCSASRSTCTFDEADAAIDGEFEICPTMCYSQHRFECKQSKQKADDSSGDNKKCKFAAVRLV
jgi:hypothetical protein